MEGYDIAEMGFGSEAYIHTFTEAKKLAFEDRAKYYADMDFAQVPVQQLISKAYAEERRKLINPDRAARRINESKLRDGDTIYLTVADENGNMVSLIQSNYRGMGSGMTPPGLGFVLQDRGELFSLDENHMNAYQPGKRPFHTIIPAFITKDGKPWVSFGLMGGAMQPQGHAQIVVNLIDFKMNLQEAGDAPRIQHGGSSQPTGQVMTDGGILYLETGIDYDVIRALAKKGHKIQFKIGNMEAIKRSCGTSAIRSIMGQAKAGKTVRQQVTNGSIPSIRIQEEFCAKRILSSIKYQSLFFNFDNLQKKLLPIIALKHWPNQSIGSFT